MQASVLGRLLIDLRVITEAQLAAALAEQRQTRERIGEVLIRRGASAEQVAGALARQLKLPFAQAPLLPDRAALRLVDRALATRLLVAPIKLTDKCITVAFTDPLDLRAVEDLEFQTGRRVQVVVASKPAVRAALAAYDADAVVQLVDRLPRGVRVDEADLGTLEQASQAPPIVALVDHLLQQAAALRASDLHIEPNESMLRVRVRVDGALAELVQLPISAAPALVSRLKVLAGLDISVKRKPQDGRAGARIAERDYALRVSTLPTQLGEKVVLRLLDSTNVAPSLSDLGMSAADHERLGRMIQSPHGLLLVTGPTGSGKTSTLYGLLAAFDRATRNLVTLEDPVEYRLPGITQVQVQRRAGITFATALRAVLRQDPDVIMVGELRDRETVAVALAAAATGHLVLSTLHTNDAPGAVTRLLHLGAPPYLVSATLVGVIAQRLVRKRCLCAGSCGKCQHGLRGRTGVFELLLSSARLRALISARAAEDQLRQQAVTDGMRTLAQDARRLVEEGRTTEAETRPLLVLD